MAAETPAAKQYGGSILEAFLPKKEQKSTTSQTETQKTDLNPDAVNELIRSMMESDQGLASILQRQAGGGLYNSTTAQLLTNDLTARVAGKTALASAPMTKSATQTQKSPGNAIDPKWALGLQLVGELFGSKSGSNPGGSKGNLGGLIDSIGGSDFFQSIFGTADKDKDKFNQFNPNDNYGGFGFTDTQFSDFNLGGFSPDASLALGGGNTYSYDQYALTGGGNNDWLLGTGYSGGLNTGGSSFSGGSSGTTYGANIGSVGGSPGISFGFTF